MPHTSLGYRAVVRLGTALIPGISLLDPKLREGHLGRRRAGQRLVAWARSGRDPARPLVWFHAASVGEGLQAESVLLELRRRRPKCQLVYTHFSPSAEPLARRLPVDVADFLPYDLPATTGKLLDVLAPDLLVFSKLDLWPELAAQAAQRRVTVAIVAATVSRGSGRMRWPVRSLLGPGYRSVDAAAAVSQEDAERLERLGVASGRIRVLGDPRFDSIVARVRAVAPDDPLLRFGRGAPTLVAGSTWPADEEVLVETFARIHVHRPDARLLLVPHEPTATRLERIEARARRAGLPAPVRLSRAETPVPLLLVDRVGVLASLYGAGTMAYVGGGFGRAGLHSVLEPAAWGIPVAFGPRWRDSRDALVLLEAGAAEALLQLGTGEAAEALRDHWESWMVDEPRRAAQGRRGREVVAQGLGAAERSARLLDDLISSRPLRRSPTEGRSVPG